MIRYLFIHNPAANRYRSADDFKQVRHLAEQALEHCRFVVSAQQGDISNIIERRASDFDVVVACGGDGTVREAAIATLGRELSLGVIPMGSGNDFTKSLQIPSDIAKAIALIRKNRRAQIDVGYCNDIPFFNSFGFGFDGLTNQYASQSGIKNGTFRYILAALKANMNRNTYLVTIRSEDSAELSTSVMMITAANGRVEGGNFCIAPDASITDAKLDLVLLKPVPKWLLPLKLPFFLNGSQVMFKEVQIKKVQRCNIKFDKAVEMHADGEVIAPGETGFAIRLEPGKLSVISGLDQ